MLKLASVCDHQFFTWVNSEKYKAVYDCCLYLGIWFLAFAFRAFKQHIWAATEHMCSISNIKVPSYTQS